MPEQSHPQDLPRLTLAQPSTNREQESSQQLEALPIRTYSTPLCLESQYYENIKTLDDPMRPNNLHTQTAYQDSFSDENLTVYDADKNSWMAKAWKSSTYTPSEHSTRSFQKHRINFQQERKSCKASRSLPKTYQSHFLVQMHVLLLYRH